MLHTFFLSLLALYHSVSFLFRSKDQYILHSHTDIEAVLCRNFSIMIVSGCGRHGYDWLKPKLNSHDSSEGLFRSARVDD